MEFVACKLIYFALPRKLEMAVISSTAMDQTSSGVCRPIPCPHVSCLMTLLRNQRVNQSLIPVYGMTFLTVDISSPNISRHMVLSQSKVEIKLVYYILYTYCMIVREIWRFIPPWKFIFLEGNARGKYDFSWGINLHIFLTIMQYIVNYTKRQVII